MTEAQGAEVIDLLTALASVADALGEAAELLVIIGAVGTAVLLGLAGIAILFGVRD